MAPLKKSVVSTFARPAITASQPLTVPHLPLGTVPFASSPHIVPVKGKPVSTEKKKLPRAFVAPAYMPPSIKPKSPPESAVPATLCQEEPLLCGPVPEDSSAADIVKSKQVAIARMRKSWLNRFYQQIAKARTDTLSGNSNFDGGTRSPSGLPGMASDFVFAPTTGPTELDVATVFVVARLHTRIQMNDWESIVKDEQVMSVTKRGGGIWKVSTRTHIHGLARQFGCPLPQKTETDTYLVIGDTGDVIGKGNEDTLRIDWKNLLSEDSRDSGKALIELLRTKDDLSYPHGIAAGWTRVAKKGEALMDEYRMAEKYVLSNVMPNR
ncbi:hypothetical protein NCC49_003310 [Naganishia albida]|nr:hypothetical protein NCC49_003310 [Naganishia albida]